MPISVDHIIDALSALGGRAHLDSIVSKVTQIAPLPHPVDVGASVRARIQERSSDTSSFKGGVDLFFSVYGVDKRQGWWGLRSDPLSPGQDDGFQDGPEALLEAEEGRAELRIHLRRERSRKLVQTFKAGLETLACCICDFDFEATYGERGRGYVEAHHTIPVAALKEGERTRVGDLIAVCANCHRMLHYGPLLDWRDLRQRMVKQDRKAVGAPVSS